MPRQIQLIHFGANENSLSDTQNVGVPTGPLPSGVSPFRVEIPLEAIVDMRRRLGTAKMPEKETVGDSSQGVQLSVMKELVRYWGAEYDWRKAEAKLNTLPQFITNIDGLDIHFIHVRSKHENALPLIVTHGWPGSIIEQLKIIAPLTDPTAHGGRAEDAFHIVIPSIPGYGFSGKPQSTGWNNDHVARAWDTLMKRLGYTRYVAQGGDLGAYISDAMARQAPPGLLGIHINLLFLTPPEIAKALATGEPAPAGLSEKEKTSYEQRKLFNTTGRGYFIMQATRPQTIGYSLVDSPAGLAAWILGHDTPSYDLIARAFEGHPGGLSRDDVLDNITLYWLTNTGASAARSYWEAGRARPGTTSPSVPVAFSEFPDEIFRAPETWARRVYPNLVYYHEADKGGHFAAWEVPELFSSELRAAFRTLR